MGRKAKFDGTQVPKGPGRKARKQSDPTFPKGVLGMKKYQSFIRLIQNLSKVMKHEFIILQSRKQTN